MDPDPGPDRTHENQPLFLGHASQQTHDYKRNGTTTLFAALDVLTGKVSANAFYQRHTNTEFVDSWARLRPYIRMLNCTSSVITTPRKSTKTSRTGWPRTRG
ncbi:hypothetical protein ABIB27_001021 [Arthrobacter sp. UYEF21]